MTIRFITAWNGYTADKIVSGLSSIEEARMISLGFAVADLDGPGNGSLPVTYTPKVPNILFFGDSIPGYGYDPETFPSPSTTAPFGGSAFSVVGVSWASGSGSGTLNFDKTAKTLKWSPAVGGGFGATVDVSKSGVYDVPGPAEKQWIRVVCRPRYYSTATEGDVTETVTANTERSRMGCKNFPAWVKGRTGCNVYILSNGGSTLFDLIDASRQIADFNITFDAIVLQGGTNDIHIDNSLLQMKASFDGVVSLLQGYSSLVIPLTIPPRSASMTAGKRQKLFGMNRYILGKVEGGVVPVNTFQYLADPASANSDPLALMLEDGVHPSPLGANRLSAPVADKLIQLLGQHRRISSGIADSYDATNNPSGNAIAAQSCFTGSGGTVGAGVTGPVPDGWVLERESGANITAVLTTPARPDGLPGNCAKIVVTGSTSRQIMVFRTGNIAVLPGEKWKARCRFRLENPTGIESVALYLDPNLAGQKRVEWGAGAVSGTNMPTTDEYFYAETETLTIPASGITNLKLYLQVIASATGIATIYMLPGEIEAVRV